ncbi:MAG: galactan 5-O-arabinofuranosyltransferase [Frankiaceae bacterium]|nr:galactan 5-O-arabinofuranosyltransferase [Frankiaceae bacterium]
MSHLAESPTTVRDRVTAAGVPAAAAFGTWLLFVLIAIPVRHHFGAHALSARTQVLPLGLGVLLVLAAAALVVRRPISPLVAGILLGAMAGWVSFSILAILAGTQFPAGGMYGDCGRTVAAAQRFRLSWGSGDQFISGHPSWYPPLWFWLWGRSAALVGKDAWQIGAVFQGTGLGLIVLATGFAWRLVLKWPRALAATAATTAILFGPFHFDPCKGHEISATMLVVPAVLFAHLVVVDVLLGRQRRLAAAGAGVLLGICLLLYQIVVIFPLVGLLVLWVVSAVRAKRLASFGIHVACAAAAGFVAVSWYVIPLIPVQLHNKYPRGHDLLMVYYGFSHLPGLFTGSITITLTAVVAAVLVAVFVRTPLGQGVATVAVACVLIQGIALLNIVKGGEDFYSYRTYYILIVLAATSIVLFTDPLLLPARAQAVLAVRRFAIRRAVVALGVGLMLFAVDQAWAGWHAPITPLEALAKDYPKTAASSQAARAYITPLPNCGKVRGLPASIHTAPCFPAARIQDCINKTYGKGALPILVAYDERLAGFYGDYYYLGNDGGAGGPYDALAQHTAYLTKLSQATDAADLLAMSRHTPFGPIEGYVLSVQRNGDYRWVAQIYHGKNVVNFAPGLFDDPAWAVCRSGPAIVLLDRSARPAHA